MEELELTIGFYYQYGSEYCKMTHIDTTEKIVVLESILGITYATSIKNIHPINLTNKMLVDVFGFKKKQKSTYGYKFTYPILDWGFVVENSYKKDTFFFGHEHYDAPNPQDCFKTLNFCFDLMYVHELQRLFLATKPINKITLEPLKLELNVENF